MGISVNIKYFTISCICAQKQYVNFRSQNTAKPGAARLSMQQVRQLGARVSLSSEIHHRIGVRTHQIFSMGGVVVSAQHMRRPTDQYVSVHLVMGHEVVA